MTRPPVTPGSKQHRRQQALKARTTQWATRATPQQIADQIIRLRGQNRALQQQVNILTEQASRAPVTKYALTAAQIDKVVWLVEHQRIPVVDVATLYGFSRRTIYRYLAERRAER